jgi:hypothetical protein
MERQAHELGSSGVVVGHDRFRKNDQPTSRPFRHFGCQDSLVIQEFGHPDYSVIHIVRSSTVVITHCKLKLAVRGKKVSQRKSDCCGWFVVSRFMSRARAARVKASRAMGCLIGDFTVQSTRSFK